MTRDSAASPLFDEAVQLYQDGQLDKALRRLEAYLRGGGTVDPGAFWLIARCHHRLGHRDEALVHYRLLLAQAPDHPKVEQARQFAEELEQTPPEPDPPQATEEPPPPVDAAAAAPPEAPPPVPSPSQLRAAPAGPPRPGVGPWLLVGGGLLAAGGGAYLLSTGRDDYDAARADYAAGRGAADRIDQARRDGNLQLGAGWGLVSLGAVGLGLGGWWLLHRGEPEVDPDAAAAPQALLLPWLTPTTGGASLVLGW